jgi:uncharacterized OB-fold protein
VSDARRAPADPAPAPPCLRVADPLPLQSAEDTRLHAFYAHLAEGRLTTTRCAGCGRLDWPPRAFCPACLADRFEWADLPQEGRVHGFTVQETGVPSGYPRPLVFAMVTVGGFRVFASLTGVADPAQVAVGARVRLRPVRVADGPRGEARYLPAFAPVVEER